VIVPFVSGNNLIDMRNNIVKSIKLLIIAVIVKLHLIINLFTFYMHLVYSRGI